MMTIAAEHSSIVQKAIKKRNDSLQLQKELEQTITIVITPLTDADFVISGKPGYWCVCHNKDTELSIFVIRTYPREYGYNVRLHCKSNTVPSQQKTHSWDVRYRHTLRLLREKLETAMVDWLAEECSSLLPPE